MKTILVTGAGGSPAVNFIRSVRAIDEKIIIIGTDSSKYYLTRSEADESYLVPPANDENYINYLNFIIDKHQVEFMHVQNDVELKKISECRDKLKAKTFLPSEDTVNICMNKHETYKKWNQAGIRVPKNFFINNIDDLKQAYQELGDKIWIREMSGAGGRGSLAPRDFEQAKIWIDFHKGWGKFLASELLSADSVTWMSIWNNGELVVAQGRKRLYWELSKLSPSGVTGATGAGLTYSDPNLDELAIECVKAVDSKPNGIFSVDLTYDFSGVPNPTEINIGRFFTTHEFFTRLGLNMPEVLLRLAYGEKLPAFPKKINPLEDGWVWIRGMDFLPVLVNMSKITESEKILKENLEKLKK
ncbi:MAG: carboxylate--amine ligase [Patescibacteria group bacterium]|nr:carboxylate--amine ligase [Patescibacteria group bacterium]